jgi:hypothetical protein
MLGEIIVKVTKEPFLDLYNITIQTKNKQYNHIISDWVFDNKLKEFCYTLAKDLETTNRKPNINIFINLMEQLEINITKLRNQ